MYENNHNGPNLAKMGNEVVSWELPKHISGFSIISNLHGALNLTANLERSEITMVYLTMYHLMNEEDMEPLFFS